MLSFIDISNHQGKDGLSLSAVLPRVDAVVCKATEGLDFVDSYCDRFVQTCRRAGKPWGFYHFARNGDPSKEAAFFINSTVNYFGEGIPILDWEDGQSVGWVNEFVRLVHGQTGVWPWIYANPWRFNQGGVESNCGRWVAGYPLAVNRDAGYGLDHEMPYETDGLVCAWQFTSTGRVSGYSGDLDCNVFYGDESGWSRYAGCVSPDDGGDGVGGNVEVSTLENDEYRITIERK